MKNGVVMLAVVLSIASFAGMLRLKADVEDRVRERAKLVRERAALNEEKLILEAEWAYLARPTRLMGLAEKNGYRPLDVLDLTTLQPPVMEVSHGLVR